MTHEQMYKAVREKVIEVCPELMELSFGCDIKIHLTNGGGEEATFLGYSKDGMVCSTWAKFHDNKESVQYALPSRIVILGHPIRISHVLRAIKATGKVSTSINENGRISLLEPIKFSASAVIPNTYPVHWVGCSYDLTSDDLAQQSPETIKFLFDVLCK
jgi:hypothetical protein